MRSMQNLLRCLISPSSSPQSLKRLFCHAYLCRPNERFFHFSTEIGRKENGGNAFPCSLLFHSRFFFRGLSASFFTIYLCGDVRDSSPIDTDDFFFYLLYLLSRVVYGTVKDDAIFFLCGNHL